VVNTQALWLYQIALYRLFVKGKVLQGIAFETGLNGF